MYPKTYTCLKYSEIVTEVVEFFKQILGIDVKLSDYWSQNFLRNLKRWKETGLDRKSACFVSQIFPKTLFLYLIAIPILVLWRWSILSEVDNKADKSWQ